MDRIDRIRKRMSSLFLYPAYPVHPCLNPPKLTLYPQAIFSYARLISLAAHQPSRISTDTIIQL